MQTRTITNEDREMSPRIKESLDLYVNQGIPPGDFLLSVLSNDLFGALGRADSYNRATIFQITRYVYNNMPSNCWGSPEIVNKWIQSFKNRE
jgi:hypothetical protein